MAQRPIGYVCRSCLQAINSSKSSQQHSRAPRYFSTAPYRFKGLATFTPTESPELDALLSRWRTEIFLPSILPPEHQRLIYKKSRHDVLTTPPGVVVTVQPLPPPSATREQSTEAMEENIKLVPMSRFDRPNKKKTLQKIVDVFGETGDPAVWENLIPFLEGTRHARVELLPHFLPSLARKANIQGAGRWNTILAAASVAKKTGVSLCHTDLTRELVIGVHDRGAASHFTEEEPKKTLKRIVLMLEHEDHCGGGNWKQQNSTVKHSDMRADPVVVAAKLSFSAAEILRGRAGNDENNLVAGDVQKLLALDQILKEQGGIVGSMTTEVQQETDELEAKQPQYAKMVKHNKIIERLSVVHCALALAKRVNMKNTLGREKNVEVSIAVTKLAEAVERQLSQSKGAVIHSDRNVARRGALVLDNVDSVLKEL